jgi:four helix bundle protein
MYDFRKLDVWRKAHDLTLATYKSLPVGIERRFPSLCGQLRRAAASVPANIVEGCGHSSRKEFARFLQLAMASAHEVHYHLILGRDLGMLPSANFARLEARTEEVKKMLTGLLKRVRSTLQARSDPSLSPVTRRL